MKSGTMKSAPRHTKVSRKMRGSSWVAICAMLLGALCIAVAYKTYAGPQAKQSAATESIMVEEL